MAGRYSLQALLAAGVQPLPDLDGEAFEALRAAVGRGPLADPLTISADGHLLDGHQRARALLANGRKFIDASEVHVVDAANADNAFEYAVSLNVARRHLSVDQKADLARKMQLERRWSQGKIAKLFGVSRPAVSQWLARYAEEEPADTEGLDGKVRAPKAKTGRTPAGPGLEVKKRTNNYLAQISDPELARWICDHAEPADLLELAEAWKLIAGAAEMIADSLEASVGDSKDEAF